MKLHHAATALFLVFGLVVTARAADVDKEKLLGKWECTEGPEHIKGGTVELFKDGKGKITHKDKDGKEVTENFTYVIDGDTFKVTHKGEDGKDVTSPHKVKTLTDKEMVVENEKGDVAKFKKK